MYYFDLWFDKDEEIITKISISDTNTQDSWFNIEIKLSNDKEKFTYEIYYSSTSHIFTFYENFNGNFIITIESDKYNYNGYPNIMFCELNKIYDFKEKRDFKNEEHYLEFN